MAPQIRQLEPAGGTTEGQCAGTLRAYKQSPAPANSTWHKGILARHMAGFADNDGAINLVISTLNQAPNRHAMPTRVRSERDKIPDRSRDRHGDANVPALAAFP